MTCECNNKCKDHCGCAEPVFSVESMPDNPSILRFNVNGKSIWYDFDSVVKAAETCTTFNTNIVNRTLDYHGECSEQTISAKELGAILHLGDLGDVNEDSIKDNGILNYRKTGDCPEGCDGDTDGWVSSSPIEIGGESLDYILGSDADGKMTSLIPPTDTTRFSYLSFAAQGKVKWVTPTEVASIPDDGTYQYPVYMDPATGELVVYKRSIV